MLSIKNYSEGILRVICISALAFGIAACSNDDSNSDLALTISGSYTGDNHFEPVSGEGSIGRLPLVLIERVTEKEIIFTYPSFSPEPGVSFDLIMDVNLGGSDKRVNLSGSESVTVGGTTYQVSISGYIGENVSYYDNSEIILETQGKAKNTLALNKISNNLLDPGRSVSGTFTGYWSVKHGTDMPQTSSNINIPVTITRLGLINARTSVTSLILDALDPELPPVSIATNGVVLNGRGTISTFLMEGTTDVEMPAEYGISGESFTTPVKYSVSIGGNNYKDLLLSWQFTDLEIVVSFTGNKQ